MDRKNGENQSCCAKCLGCIMCCNLPASAGVKIVSMLSILLGLVYGCLGIWTLIVANTNSDLPEGKQLWYEIWMTDVDDSAGAEGGVVVSSKKKIFWLNAYYGNLIGLGTLALSVGFVRALSSIFLLWNSVEKHSILPGKIWILLIITGTLTTLTYLLVTLCLTGFITDSLFSPVKVVNDKYSFYVLITIFRFISFSDVFLTIYFVFIVLWFVRTR